MYDVLIIGAGIIGTTLARELSKYNIKTAIIEKSFDVSNGTTKANSAIVHAGYDPKPGTLMAKFNREGNLLFERLCRDLEVPFKRIGSLVLAFNKDDSLILDSLIEKGNKNGVKGLVILNSYEVKSVEKNVNNNVVNALFAESAAVVSPYELAIACIENAIVNGVELFLNNEVKSIFIEDEIFNVYTEKSLFKSKLLINAAGIYSDKINNILSVSKFKIIPKKGQYILLSKGAGDIVSHVVFQCPSNIGKGILVTPTVYGNTLIGPDSKETTQKDDLSIDGNDIEYIKKESLKSINNIPFGKTIKTFAGLRAEADTGDFIVGESPDVKNFINIAGMKSPGLTAAPAIAEHVADMICSRLTNVKLKENFVSFRESPNLKFMNDERAKFLLKSNLNYRERVCLCEDISKGEIVDALSRVPLATDLDGVKRRIRAGMGGCQGRRCSVYLNGLISEALAKKSNSI